MVGISSVVDKLSAKTAPATAAAPTPPSIIASFVSKLSDSSRFSISSGNTKSLFKSEVSSSTKKSSSELRFSPKKVGSESEKLDGTSISISSGNLSDASKSFKLSITFSSIISSISSKFSIFSSGVIE